MSLKQAPYMGALSSVSLIELKGAVLHICHLVSALCVLENSLVALLVLTLFLYRPTQT